ncbi:MAG TPA: FtsQ-type POTRA domain-containing protein [Candidatus Faecousia intestinavium]|nr:FtsQ-type POTRA domain-containing protein [Candidatus Faecousia intestinavium]
MDTTQKNREQPARRPRQQASQETGRVPRQQAPQDTGRVQRPQMSSESARTSRREEDAGRTALKNRPESSRTQENAQGAARQRRTSAEAQKSRPSAQKPVKGKAPRKKGGLMGAITGLLSKPASDTRKQEKAARQAPARQPERKTPTARNEARTETPRTRTAPETRNEAHTEAPRTRTAPETRNETRTEAPRTRTAPETRNAPAAGAPRKASAQRSAPRKRKEEITDLSSKKRAYGNSKPKKKSAFTQAREMVASALEKSKARNKTKKGGARQGQPAPAIIYTQPKAFNRTRLLVQMLTVTAVVAAMVAGLSVFFKVENITVTGAEVYSAWSIREASGIQEGDSLLTFSHARAGALIKANKPYVKTVRFGIKLPDTVNIIIEEEDVVYAIEDSTGSWWLINSDGEVVEQTNKSKAANYTKILGVTLENPTPGRLAVAVEAAPQVTTASDATDPTTTTESLPTITTGAQRLTTALGIVDALEANDIVGEAASVDVTRLEDIILWYGSRYQVNLGDESNMEYKIACMNDAILQLSEFDSGILDISFTIWPDQVGYTPFA